MLTCPVDILPAVKSWAIQGVLSNISDGGRDGPPEFAIHPRPGPLGFSSVGNKAGETKWGGGGFRVYWPGARCLLQNEGDRRIGVIL